MDNIFQNNDIFSTESDDSIEENILDGNIFMSMKPEKEYEQNRNNLFTPDIVKKNIVIDSHNYYHGDTDFSTSNFDVIFHYEKEADSSNSSLVTTNYDIYKDVIGFKLIGATIRTPPYNINTTNNIIKYTTSADNNVKIHTLTIKPGHYDLKDIEDVFTKYEGANIGGDVVNNIHRIYSQYLTYDDTRITTANNNYTLSSKVFFRNSASMDLPETEKSNGHDIKFKLQYNNSDDDNETITILWDYNNITRGAALLFGFSSKLITSKKNTESGNKQELYSDRIIDISSHYLDVVIPEIPHITCKKNSSGKDIIERIQLEAGHGEFVHYQSKYEGDHQTYFYPTTLHRLNIQLWSQNNELYDTNNSEVSFEFEITMLKNKNLLK